MIKFFCDACGKELPGYTNKYKLRVYSKGSTEVGSITIQTIEEHYCLDCIKTAILKGEFTNAY